MQRVLITDDVHPLLRIELEKRNWEVTYKPDISLSQTLQEIGQYQGLVINSKIIADRHFLSKAKHLKWIARLGSGMEIIDIPAAQEMNIQLINTPEGNSNSVAEHALAMLLGLLRNIPRANKEIRENYWLREKNRGEELAGKTVGIIGYGHTGSAFAGVLRGLNVKVLVYEKYKQLPDKTDRYECVKGLQQIQQEADIISLHLPLNPETNYLVDKTFLEQCKDGVILLNTSRGGIIKTDDLLEALLSGKVGGACLDVFENEKPDSFSESEERVYKKLFQLDQVVLSPHIAGWTHQSKEKIAKILIEKLDLLKS